LTALRFGGQARAHDGCDVKVVSEPGKGLRVYRAPARQRRELIEVKMAAESGANLLHCKCRLLPQAAIRRPLRNSVIVLLSAKAECVSLPVLLDEMCK
jgi:hypothetical protein